MDLIFELSTLHRSIIVGLDLTLNRMMTRDAEGVVFIWDLSSAVEEGAKAHNAGNREEIERRLVLREIKKTRYDVHIDCISKFFLPEYSS